MKLSRQTSHRINSVLSELSRARSLNIGAEQRWTGPLCYAQIGGLAVATFITLLLVPVFYTIAVLDLRFVTWETAWRAVDREGADHLTSNAQ